MRLRGGVDVLVATPGRLLDLVNQNAVKLDKVETLVLDEADRIAGYGLYSRYSQKLSPCFRKNVKPDVFSDFFRRHTQAHNGFAG